MEIQSLSYSTLLHQLSFSSNVINKGDYILVSTPHLPFYYWGNFLLFPEPPTTGDYDRWTSLFQREFANIDCSHVAFAWDSQSGEKGDIQLFESAGYYFEFDEILTANRVSKPANYNNDIQVQTLLTDAEWAERVNLNQACGDERNAHQIHELSEHHRKDTQQVGGVFLGAFLDGNMVGEMALYRGGNRHGLLSMVKTHPQYRRRGICRTLLYQVVKMGIEQFDFKNFVMVADVKGSSSSVYKSAGFQVVEHGASLIKKS